MAYFKCKGFNAYIEIYSTANATVTATTTGKAYGAVCNADGYAKIIVQKKGEYNITSTGTTRIAHASITSASQSVTAQYRWEKYNSDYYYYQQANTISQSPYQLVSIWQGTPSSYYAPCRGSSYSFNESNGMFTLNDPKTYYYPSQSGGEPLTSWSDGRVYGGAGTPTRTNVTSRILQQLTWSGDNHAVSAVFMGTYARLSYYGSGDPAYWYDWYSSGTYRKGTYIEVANSSNLNAHPTDGRDGTDGYWYVAA